MAKGLCICNYFSTYQEIRHAEMQCQSCYGDFQTAFRWVPERGFCPPLNTESCYFEFSFIRKEKYFMNKASCSDLQFEYCD